MKPAPFDHVAPTVVDEAVALLAGSPGAVPLAGGQSLVPLLALRRLRPTLLVDLNDLGLDHVEPASGGELVLGALVRHRRLERDPVVASAAPLLARAAAHVGHAAVRHRGTLGGSLAYADPAAELPCALVALGGSVVVEGPAGRRTVAAADLFAGPFASTLAPDELIVEVRVPASGPGHRAAFAEWAPRYNDRAVAAVALAVERPAGVVRAAVGGVAGTPVDVSDQVAAVLDAAEGVDDGLLRAVADAVEAALGTASDAAELAGLLAARALAEALAEPEREPEPGVPA